MLPRNFTNILELVNLVSRATEISLDTVATTCEAIGSDARENDTTRNLKFHIRDTRHQLLMIECFLTENTAAKTIEATSIFGVFSARIKGVCEFRGKEYIFQEFLPGETLEKFGHRVGSDYIAVIAECYEQLTALTEEDSSVEAAVSELERLIKSFLELDFVDDDIKSYFETNFIPQSTKFLQAFEINTRFSHGDLNVSNIILLRDQSFRLIDFEFSHRTHFWREDILRLAFSCRSSRLSARGLRIFDDVMTDPFLNVYYWLRQAVLINLVLGREQFAKEFEFVKGSLREAISNFDSKMAPVKESESTLLKLYWTESSTFLEELSVTSEIKCFADSTVSFVIPLSDLSMNRLRIDPFEDSGVFIISEVTILSNDGEVLNTRSGAALADWLTSDAETALFTSESCITAVALGKDPQIYFTYAKAPKAAAGVSLNIRIRAKSMPGVGTAQLFVSRLFMGSKNAQTAIENLVRWLECANNDSASLENKIRTAAFLKKDLDENLSRTAKELARSKTIEASLRTRLASIKLQDTELRSKIDEVLSRTAKEFARSKTIEASLRTRLASIRLQDTELKSKILAASQQNAELRNQNELIQKTQQDIVALNSSLSAEKAVLEEELDQSEIRLVEQRDGFFSRELKNIGLLCLREDELRKTLRTESKNLALVADELRRTQEHESELVTKLARVSDELLIARGYSEHARALISRGSIPRLDRILDGYSKIRSSVLKRFSKESLSPASIGARFHIDIGVNDREDITRGLIRVKGWFLDRNALPSRNMYVIIGKTTTIVSHAVRRDVCECYKLDAKSLLSGFELTLARPREASELQLWAETVSFKSCLLLNTRLEPSTAPLEEIETEPKIIPRRSQQSENRYHPNALPLYGQARKAHSTGMVSVVVPIYNAPEHLSKCINSLALHLPPEWELVLVDDCSPDRSVVEAIESARGRFAHLVIHYSKANLGFIGTCNFSVSELVRPGNHVLLLNSDTEVTAGAFDEMLSVLNLSDRHAAVCPRSNNATILTIRRGSSTDPQESYDFWAQTKGHFPRYSNIPTGIGFCMLLRYELLRLFGLFDPIYGKGYQEENDWICRVNRFGYGAVSANHAYVYHYESQSFGARREQYDAKNQVIIHSRYPEFLKKLDIYTRFERHPIDVFSIVLDRQAPHILLDLSELPAAVNGTAVYCTRIALHLARLAVGKADISVRINRSAFDFHSSYFAPNTRIVFTDESDSTLYDLAFHPAQLWDGNSLKRLSKSALRICFTMHDIIALRCDYLAKIDERKKLKEAIALADNIISISSYTAEDTKRYFNCEFDCKVIYHGFDNHGGVVTPPRPNAALLIGNHYSHKAVRECAHVLRAHPDLTILGGSPDWDVGTAKLFPSGGQSDEVVSKLLSDSQVHIYPSLFEGFGLPLVQAAAMRRWIIAHDNQLNRELVEALSLRNVILFSEFEDIPNLLTQLDELAPESPIRTWTDSASEHLALFLTMLQRPANWDLIQDRWNFNT